MFAVTYSKIFLGISAAIIIGSIAIIATFGLNLGIDFTGGALTEIAYDERPDKDELADGLDALNLGGYSLRETVEDAGREGYILRTRDLSEAERQSMETVVLSEGVGAELIRFTSIGPVIGEELKDKAVWAVGAVISVIILYVAFAFAGVGKPVGSWVYGGITILALAHDVLVPTALVSLLGYFAGFEIDVLFVMAILAVLGYSVNDTIVVFDRVRENLVANRTEKRKKITEAGVSRDDVTYTLMKPFEEIVGMSVSQTIMRSVNTSLTTLCAVGALYVFGGDVTRNFSLVLIAGVVAGTYSSIFLANPLLVYIAAHKADKEH